MFDIKLIEKAALVLQNVARTTPLQYSKRLSTLYGANIYLKREDLQEVRSFKIRGAYFKISQLSDAQKKQGVVCASAGNHAQGVAYSCFVQKIQGDIFMPTVTPQLKIEKVRNFGKQYVTVHLVGDTFDEACTASQLFCTEKNGVYVHPFNDDYTIAGQGTVAKEIDEQMKSPIDMVVCAIGGGGLISGVGSYIKNKYKNVMVIGVEPTGAAGMKLSIDNRKVTSLPSIDSFVDGAAVKTVGEKTYSICKRVVDDIVTVPEGKVCTTMIELYQNDGIIAEPAGALPVCALEDIKETIRGKTVVCVISGGNNDIMRYPEIMERSLVYLGKKHYFIIEFAQKPGQLKNFLNKALGPNDDIVLFEYIKKNNKEKGPALVGIELKNKTDLDPLLIHMNEIGLKFRKIKSDDLLFNYLI